MKKALIAFVLSSTFMVAQQPSQLPAWAAAKIGKLPPPAKMIDPNTSTEADLQAVQLQQQVTALETELKKNPTFQQWQLLKADADGMQQVATRMRQAEHEKARQDAKAAADKAKQAQAPK